MRKHKADSEYLHYGCEISLSQLDNGFITACGFVSPLLNLVPFPSDFSNSLFRVIPVCIHTVQNDLLSSLDALPLPDYQKKYARLSETLEGEIKMNLQTYEKLRGESIRFGSFVYLQHSTSHKFLTISSNKTGVVERDSLQVVLSDFPNDYSCIKIEATYNFQKEGDGLIRINDIVVFEVFLNDLNKPAYISSSVKNMYKDYKKKFNSGKEINASFDKKTKWRIHLYDSVKQNDKKILSCGDCLWISHTEGKVILKALIENTEDVLFFQKNLSDANGLWKVESENDQVGGSVYTDKMYRLRHLNSGFYLTLAKEDSEEIYYGALGEKDDPSSLWTFESIYSWKKKFRVEMDQFFYIKNVETELKLQGIEDPYHFDGIKLEFTKDSSETSYFKIFKNDVTSLWETQFIIACVQIAKSYQEFLYEIKKLNVNESLAILKQFRKNSEIMNTCMEELDLFLQHMQKSSFSTGKNYGRVDKSRQKKFLELHMFDFLAEILDACFEGDMSLHKVFENKDEGRKNAVKMSKNTEISSVLLREVIKTVQIIYKVTGTACLDNSENQSYAYQFIYIYQKHAGYELGATKCITAILKNNDNLLGSLQKTIINFETGKATTTVIDHYTWLLRVLFI